MKIRLFLKKIIEYKYTPHIFFVLWFIAFVILSLFRDSRLDENIYLADSVQISNLLKSGEWIGNYGVGMHGFLSKLLVGIVFIFTGPSVFIATLLNILFGIFSGVLFYKMLFKHFKCSKLYALLGVTLLFCSYQFLTYIPTFYRDIEALFFLILVLSSILDKKNKWLTGLFLLLLLDAKEHVFFTVAPAFVLWIGIESYINNKGKVLNWIKEFIVNNVKLFLQSLTLLILMFTTSIVPLNIYNANILGLIKGGTETMATDFEPEMATHNRDTEVNKDTAKVMPLLQTSENTSPLILSFVSFVNVVLSYLGKILYPRTFSFLSVPFIIIIPSVIYAIRNFIEHLRKKEKEKLILPITLVIFLVIYVIHASIGRYIIPIVPVIILFFLLFLQNLSNDISHKKSILIFTFIFIIAGLYFEYSYVWIKVGINIILFLLLIFVALNNKWTKEIFKYIFITLISLFCLGTALLASYTNGQIYGYRLYGYNRECEKIIALVDENETILINDIDWDKLPFLLRKENLGESEWRWKLKEWIPKKKLLKPSEVFGTYDGYWGNSDILKEYTSEKKIEKIVYIHLLETDKRVKLLLQDRLDVLLNLNRLSLDEKINLKNKDVYIFTVHSNI